ncbi:hypothetical protein AAIO65_02485 [Erwinia amylovora]|uniref:hypothetical protein n=1 Tax=Erwinia amylovora TaxID=552 RepID=UPI001443D6F9|nr:hypothetical protein [Erwinia amylovora]
MPISPITSIEHTTPNTIQPSNQKNISQVLDKIKMAYGFCEDISTFKKIDRTTISLDDLNRISGLFTDNPLKSPSVLMRKILTKNLKIDDLFLKRYCNETSIKESDLRGISEKWIEYLSNKSDELSLCKSLNRRDEKTENGFLDFVLKNTTLYEDNPKLRKIALIQIQHEKICYKTIQLVYNAFKKSDELGLKTLDNPDTCKNTGYRLIESSIGTALLRKISKIAMVFATSPSNNISQLVFIKPDALRGSIVLVNASNQDLWRGKNDLSGIVTAYEPITHSELRYARKNDLPIYYF